jgi:hypothetical protein
MQVLPQPYRPRPVPLIVIIRVRINFQVRRPTPNRLEWVHPIPIHAYRIEAASPPERGECTGSEVQAGFGVWPFRLEVSNQ